MLRMQCMNFQGTTTTKKARDKRTTKKSEKKLGKGSACSESKTLTLEDTMK